MYAPYIQFWSTMFDINKLCENHIYDNYNTTRIYEALINNFFATILLQLCWVFVHLPNWVKRRYKEPQVLLYISPTCPFSQKWFFHTNDFLNDFFLQLVMKND